MPRGPIKISLEQLRIAARKVRRPSSSCGEETMRIMDALEPAQFHVAPLYKYLKEYDECMEKAKMEKKRSKPSTLFYLSKYLVQDKNKKK